MTNRQNLRGARLATRICFFVSGFGVACWAPLVPLAKLRLGVSNEQFGLLLLCLGLGSVCAMQAISPLIARRGVRSIIMAGATGMAILLPALSVVTSVPGLAIGLTLFGACLGALEVAMNMHAVEVEKRDDRPLMSGFHALFSIGGFAGSAALSLMLSAACPPLDATALAALLIMAALLPTYRLFIVLSDTQETPFFIFPRGCVILLALLAFLTFLIEGAMLDWGALLLTGRDLVTRSGSGLGYSIFSAFMTVGRLMGDRVVAWLGDRITLVLGGFVALGGFVTLLLASGAFIALSGFALIGLGASNIVPVLYRATGRQTVMSAGLAVASVTTIGYAGILLGPAAIGAIAHILSLPGAFWLLAALLCLVPLTAKAATVGRR